MAHGGDTVNMPSVKKLRQPDTGDKLADNQKTKVDTVIPCYPRFYQKVYIVKNVKNIMINELQSLEAKELKIDD